jgi:hypothetical protein
MERISVSRDKKLIGGESIETLEPFKAGETLSGIFPHFSRNGGKHKGNMKIEIITDTIRFRAEAVCVHPGCQIRVEVEGAPSQSCL